MSLNSGLNIVKFKSKGEKWQKFKDFDFSL